MQCIAIIYCKCKLSFFSKDNTRQAKSLIFIVALQAEEVPKVQKKQKQNKKLKLKNKKKQTKRDVLRTLFRYQIR